MKYEFSNRQAKETMSELKLAGVVRKSFVSSCKRNKFTASL